MRGWREGKGRGGWGDEMDKGKSLRENAKIKQRGMKRKTNRAGKGGSDIRTYKDVGWS